MGRPLLTAVASASLLRACKARIVDVPASLPVIILCGGRGTRISEVNPLLPKPLLPIGDRPVLWHIMKVYAAYGHVDFVLALGYLGEEIKRFFLHYQPLTCDFTIEL